MCVQAILILGCRRPGRYNPEYFCVERWRLTSARRLFPAKERVKKSANRLKSKPQRRPREGGDPYKSLLRLDKWIPAFAGMTLVAVPAAFRPGGERAKLAACCFAGHPRVEASSTAVFRLIALPSALGQKPEIPRPHGSVRSPSAVFARAASRPGRPPFASIHWSTAHAA